MSDSPSYRRTIDKCYVDGSSPLLSHRVRSWWNPYHNNDWRRPTKPLMDCDTPSRSSHVYRSIHRKRLTAFFHYRCGVGIDCHGCESEYWRYSRKPVYNERYGYNAIFLYSSDACTVAASSGSNSTCIPTPPTSPAVVHPNVTGTLTTCEPWGLTMTGGKKPYHMVIAGTSSPVITNVTMGDNDDVLTYIDRADPNTGLMGELAIF